MPTKRLLVLKKHAFVVAITYTIAITILSFISINDIPDLGINFADKIAHLIIYTLFTLFWFNVFKQTEIKNSFVLAILVAIIYGIIIEILQGSLTQVRQFDYFDIAANVIGALLALPIIRLIKLDVKK